MRTHRFYNRKYKRNDEPNYIHPGENHIDLILVTEGLKQSIVKAIICKEDAFITSYHNTIIVAFYEPMIVGTV